MKRIVEGKAEAETQRPDVTLVRSHVLTLM